jgi:NlpC/P60 family putative phage cell wall peptidase
MSGAIDLSPTRKRIITAALDWLGTPYRHQGHRKGVGCDCLGLLLGVWREVYGVLPERPYAYAPDWAEGSGREDFLAAARRHCREIGADEARAGDLLLFRWRDGFPAKHAAILVGSDRFVHAYEGSAVMVSTLVPQWRRRIAAAFVLPDPADRP